MSTQLKPQIGQAPPFEPENVPLHVWLEQDEESVVVCVSQSGKLGRLFRIGSSFTDGNRTNTFKCFRLYGGAKNAGLAHDSCGRALVAM